MRGRDEVERVALEGRWLKPGGGRPVVGRCSGSARPWKGTYARASLLCPVVALLMVSAPNGLAAQSPRWRGWDSPEARIAVGDGLHFRMQPLEAFRVFQRVVEDDPEHYVGLWKSTQEAVILGIIALDEDEQTRWFRTGEEYARRAIMIEPDDPAGHYWLAAALGRRAVQSDAATTAGLAAEIYEEAHVVLRLDSLHAGAHNVLGTFNYEVMKMSGVKRFIARTFFSSEGLAKASWEDAECYTRRAVELDPTSLLYRLDLGKLYFKRNQHDLARTALNEVLELPSIHPPDPTFKRQARELLDDLH